MILRDDIPRLLSQAMQHGQAGQSEQAKQISQSILAEHPNTAAAHYILGMVTMLSSDGATSIDHFEKAVGIEPNNSNYLQHAGVAYCKQGDFQRGIDYYLKALNTGEASPELLNNLSVAYQKSNQLEQGAALFQKLNADLSGHPFAQFQYGKILVLQQDYQSAVPLLQNAAPQLKQIADVWFNLGIACQQLQQDDEALNAYQSALQLKSNHHQSHNNLALIYEKRKQYSLAVQHFNLAVNAMPTFQPAWKNLGNLLRSGDKFADACKTFEQGLRHLPNDTELLTGLFNVCRAACMWPEQKGCEQIMRSVVFEKIDAGEFGGLDPFTALCMYITPEQQQQIAQNFAKQNFSSIDTRTSAHDFSSLKIQQPTKLKVGYISANFREHATAHNFAGLLPLHNKEQFEICAYSVGENDGSEYRRLIESSVDQFVDLADMDSTQAVKRIRDDSIHVLVNMMGYTQGARSEICAQRAAPVQINYQGFPGTMGVNFMDYIIADKTVLPASDTRFYDEQPIYMPHQYFAADSKQTVSDIVPSRAECGLPENVFVFACFSGGGKIDQRAFDIWMDLLHQVPDSVLWLFNDVEIVRSNLRAYAVSKSIDKNRIVFANRVSKDLHLARHTHIDLFLDSFVYNAHTTAVDALLMGVPVITFVGATWVTRVAASLLYAADMPELVTGDVTAYAKLALSLASDNSKLEAVKRRLQVQRQTAPLFDSTAYVQALESAFDLAWKNYAFDKHASPIYVS